MGIGLILEIVVATGDRRAGDFRCWRWSWIPTWNSSTAVLPVHGCGFVRPASAGQRGSDTTGACSVVGSTRTRRRIGVKTAGHHVELQGTDNRR